MNKIPLKELPIVQSHYRQLTGEFLKYMPHDRFYIAGGFARFCIEQQLSNGAKAKIGPPSDLDIYLLKKEDVEETVKAIHNVACEKYLNKKWPLNGRRFKEAMFNSPYSFTLNCTPVTLNTSGRDTWKPNWTLEYTSNIPVQIIKFWNGTPEEVLSKFDFSCVSVAIDSNFVYIEEKSLDDIRNKRLSYNCRPEGFSYNTKAVLVKRVAKYCTKSLYKIYDSNLIEDLISDELIKTNKYNDTLYYNQEDLHLLEDASTEAIYKNLEEGLMLALYLSKIEGRKAEKIKNTLNNWMNRKKLTKKDVDLGEATIESYNDRLYLTF